MIFMWILIGYFIWTILSIVYVMVFAKYEPHTDKTPWYEYFVWPPLFIVAFIYDLWHKIKKK